MDPNRPSGAARASRIRDLTIDIRASLGAEGEEEFERVWKMLVDVLLSARKLRSLTVKGLLHRTRLARSLSSPRTYGRVDGINPIAASFAIPISYPSTRSHRSPSHSRRRDGTRSPQTFAPSSTGFPFRLTRFATDLHLDEHLTPFWASQAPSIHSLELLSGDVIQVQTPRVPYPLPTLRTFHASLPVQTTMMRDSPVRAAQLDGMWEGECAMVRENLCGVRKASAKLLAMETEVALNPWTSFDEMDDEDDEEGVWMRMRGQPASLPMSGGLHLSAAVSGTPSSYQPPSVLSLHPHISHPNPLTSPSTSSLPLSSIPSPALGPAILSLTLTIFDTPCTARVYTSLIAHLPHLRLLTLTHAELRDVAQRRLAMSVLAGLADLEEFEWAAGTASSGGANAAHSTNMIQSASSHTSAQADVFAALANTSSITAAGESAGSGISASAPASVKCRFLRRITFRWGSGNFFVRRFEREVRGSRRSCASGNSASYGASAWGIVQV
ncbi:hypothetical protein DL93DRAFT_1732256 [Clavulina sp. PMI_390]|nr:hypothetical protein DL93DRAFT_1732256 [Clavulina sp. PMI_390]